MIQTITTLALVAIGSADAAQPADGDNAAAMTLMCPSLQLADGDMEIVPGNTSMLPNVDDLYALNMTLASNEWQTKFTEQDSNNKFKATEIPQSEKSADWKAKWQTWTGAALKVKSSTAKADLIARYNLQDASQAQLAAIRPTLAAYVDAIFELSKSTEGQKTGRMTDQEIKNSIRQAVYGGSRDYGNSMGGKALHGGDPAGREAVCQATQPHNPIKTIATIVACICGTKHTRPNKQPCGPTTGDNVAWRDGNMPEESKWSLLRQSCPVKENNKITANTIEHAVNNAQQAIYGKDNILYVGKYDAGGCDGDQNGACIKYDGQATAGKASLEKAEWIRELHAVAEELRKREADNSETRKKAAQIEQLKALAEAATTHVTAIYTPGTQTGGSHRTKATSDSTVETREDCSKHHGKNATCPTDKCTYDEKENKCNPKVAVEGAALPGTGKGAANKKEERCAGKPEKECRDGCKWEGESCKDSSILVTKTFALRVVSAAFVALLF